MPPKIASKTKSSKVFYALPELNANGQEIIVPLSIGTEYHKNPTLLSSFFKTLVEKIHIGRIKSICFVIGDTLQGYNMLLNHETDLISPTLPDDENSIELKTAYLTALDQWHAHNSEIIDTAKKSALQQGTTWLIENKHNLSTVRNAFRKIDPSSVTFASMPSSTQNIYTMRWNDCLDTNKETIEDCTNKIRAAYINNSIFSNVINSLIQTICDRKSLTDAAEATKAHNQLCCAAYIFEELAIFGQWMQANQWDCMIYPFGQSPFNADVFGLLAAIFPASAESKTLMPIDAVITDRTRAEALKENDWAQLKLQKAASQARHAASHPIKITSISEGSPSSSVSSNSNGSSRHSSPQISPSTSPPNETTNFMTQLCTTVCRDPESLDAVLEILNGFKKFHQRQAEIARIEMPMLPITRLIPSQQQHTSFKIPSEVEQLVQSNVLTTSLS